ncbi:MAG: hypothetical protein CSA62_12940 [Planctomycetota bacterium]|nr:MAG: hypothetical protein CSA62_12940 [Planctomycetota bacterium]
MRSHSLLAGGVAGVLLFLSAPFVSAQNLVVNPSFETHSSCPSLPGQINKASGWNSPTNGSPDYDHVCGTSSTVKVPVNMWGNQTPRTGKAYAQMITYVGASASNFREYIQAPLTSALVAGTKYEISFWVSRCDKTRWACKDIGAYLSIGAVPTSPNFNPLPYTPQIQNTGGIITNSVSWVQIKGVYTATGGESHIVIGNFKNHVSSTATQLSTSGHNNAGYYIDDVSVVKKMEGPIVNASHLIGFADLPAPTPTGFLDMQEISPSCPSAFTQCKTKYPFRATDTWAGGTAYDPRFQSVWISDGVVLSEYSVEPGAMCKPLCRTVKAVIQHNRARVTGLACSDRNPRLFQLASAPGAMEITTYDNSRRLTRCLGKWTVCRYPLSKSSIATALAYDEVRDLLYVNIAVKQANGFQNVLYVAKASSPCKPICQMKYFICGRGLVTGLAYDPCSKKLYATDGAVTEDVRIIDPYKCLIRAGKCCKKQTQPVWRGLAIVPGWKQNSTGSSCTTGRCLNCPSMTAYSMGDPSLGAPFKLGLKNAPASSYAATFLKSGAPGSGIPLPAPYCGTWYAFPTLFSYPAAFTGGSSSCTGSVLRTLPIPSSPALCGFQLTVQWFVICPVGGGFGVGVSNALDFTITTS